MNNREEQIDLLVRALYEIRLLLSHKMGEKNSDDECVTIAANLAYALHNQALAITRGDVFNYEDALDSIKNFDKVSGTEFADSFIKRLKDPI